MNGQGRILARPLYIPWVLLRHGLDEIALSRFWLGRGLLCLLPWNWFRWSRRPRAERIRRALEDLGPIFVKFGQMLSTRRDLLPTDLADELALLQDRVPPFDGEVARKVIERSLGRPVQEMFSQFDTTPLASASVAQVHAARLDDTDVIVKVLRPGIEKTIRRDIRMMYRLARFLERVWEGSRRLHPVDLVAEYEGIIFDELDLTREAANASQLRRNFEDSELLYVPEVFWDYTARDVMTMERIYGIQISDREELVRHGVNLKCLAERGVEIFFTQVFDHNFFHADMHPGNIFISRETPESPKYSAVDFGIMGSLSASDQRYLAFNLAAFFNNDYRRVAELHVESGWVPPGTRVADFEAAIRTVCEPIFQRPFSEISFANLLLRLFQTASRFQMEVQPQLLLLQKTLVNIEGVGRELYPDLDLWTTAKPFMDRWVSEQTGLLALVRLVRHRLPQMVEHFLEDPPATPPPDPSPTLQTKLETSRRKLKHTRLWLAAAAIAALAMGGWLAFLHWGGG